MSKFAIRYDFEDNQYLVVRWDNPRMPTLGSIVYRSFELYDAQDWLECVEHEENLAIYHEFG